jgi:hypothetical protein
MSLPSQKLPNTHTKRDTLFTCQRANKVKLNICNLLDFRIFRIKLGLIGNHLQMFMLAGLRTRNLPNTKPRSQTAEGKAFSAPWRCICYVTSLTFWLLLPEKESVEWVGYDCPPRASDCGDKKKWIPAQKWNSSLLTLSQTLHWLSNLAKRLWNKQN